MKKFSSPSKHKNVNRRAFIKSFLLMPALLIFSAAFIQAQPASQNTKSDAKEMLVQLLAAIEKDDKGGVIKILSAGFPADFADNDGNTFLMQAAKSGKTNAAAALLAGSADPNKMAKNGATALMLAASGGHLETVKVLLSVKADPNLRGANRPTALALAASGNHIEVMKALIRLGADLQAKDEKGYTPLESSFVNRRQAALEYLRTVYLEKDATIPREPFNNKIMWFPETLIAAIGDKDQAKTLKMLALGFDPNAGDQKSGNSTLLETAINRNFGAGVSMLVFAGADINKMTVSGFPVWWLAMSDKQPAGFDLNILKYLVKSGANLSLTSKQGITPLAFAKSQKNSQFAQIVSEAGAK